MVELAIVIIPLVMIVFGITELGRALYQDNSLTKAVNIGARYIARQPDLLHSPYAENNPCAVVDGGRWSSVQGEAKNLIICGRRGDCDAQEAVVPGLVADHIHIPEPVFVPASDYGGNPACRITVTARTPFSPIFGDVVVPFTSVGLFSLTARTEERYIGG